jgi:PIN domain nuclease of toxin-antitoxin system
MIAAVADTHTALWHLFGDAKLSRAAEDFIQAVAARHDKIAVSAISVAELVYLVEKSRLPASAYDGLIHALHNPVHVFTQAVLTADIVQIMRRVSRTDVPDMPDRIVAATAMYFQRARHEPRRTHTFGEPPHRLVR